MPEHSVSHKRVEEKETTRKPFWKPKQQGKSPHPLPQTETGQIIIEGLSGNCTIYRNEIKNANGMRHSTFKRQSRKPDLAVAQQEIASEVDSSKHPLSAKGLPRWKVLNKGGRLSLPAQTECAVSPSLSSLF